jgi:hypothetical protein
MFAKGLHACQTANMSKGCIGELKKGDMKSGYRS